MTSFVYTEAARAAERYSASLACLQASEPLAPSLFQQIVVDQLDTINIATRQYLRVFGSESNRPTTLGGQTDPLPTFADGGVGKLSRRNCRDSSDFCRIRQ